MTGARLSKVLAFFHYNHHKIIYFKSLVLSFFYRMMILIFPMKTLMKFMGALNEESKSEESEESYKQATLITIIVNKVCRLTPWQSKCLVRALTIRHFLKQRSISSTLYLGVGKDDSNMIAHAWLRSGDYYISGGNGEGYALVAKFRA